MLFVFALGLVLLAGCQSDQETATDPAATVVNYPAGSFGDDLRFMQQHQDVVLLQANGGRSLVAVIGA
ncbi:MAG: hypothetical protein OIF34_12135, partial [Porticoccaceae bacterium]|nr:hypothetical protein [Porticoccaceae bacterium]